MTAQMLWEYRVISIGNLRGAKAEQVEVNLNELGQPGWEVVATEWPHNGRRLMVIAKRSLSPGQRRRRDLPGSSTANRPPGV